MNDFISIEKGSKDQSNKNSNFLNKQESREITEVITYPVPFFDRKFDRDISVTINTLNNDSKEEIIKQAIKYHLQGNIKEAMKYYQSLINQGFKDYRVFSNYGSILQSLGKSKEAEIPLRKAIKIKPNFAEAHLNLGLILRDLDNVKEAEFSTRKAIELDPNLANAHSNLGLILSGIGKLEEAEMSTRKAIDLKPDFAEAHLNLGGTLKDLGKLQEAEI